MEMQEIGRCVELSAELLRGSAHIQGPRRHDSFEDGSASPGQSETRGLQGDANEIMIGRRCCLCMPGSAAKIRPSRNHDVLGRATWLGLTPVALSIKRLR